MTRADSKVLGTPENLAVVTGAGSGIGRAIALELAGWGVSCCLVGRTLSKLEDIAGLAQELGVECIPVAVDLRDSQSSSTLRTKIQSLGRQVELLVHSAAIIRVSRFEDSTVEEFSDLLAANLLAPFALTRELLPDIRATRGQIAFVNSSVVNYPSATTAQYGASKHALKGLADGLRQEVNASGVRVISVYPGRTATPLQESLYEVEGRVYVPEDLLQAADVAEILVRALALPRTAEVTDIMIRPALKR